MEKTTETMDVDVVLAAAGIPPSDETGEVASEPEPRTLAQVEQVWSRWFAGADLGPLHATLAAHVANLHLEGDPVWLLLVGGSSRGKTEVVMSLASLEHVRVVSTIASEAGLLSGTSSKERSKVATGGLLCEVGELGLLVVKDFTSIISMHREARAQVLSALREIYDGSWTRDVGTDGGRKLHWAGKLGLVGACTSIIDRAHAVIASMGDRFLLVRLPEDSRGAIGQAALEHVGRERQMRAELAAAVAGLLFAPGEPHEFDAPTVTRLVALADLVTLARSPVARDMSGEIALVLDAEAPARAVKALGQLYRACGAIGLAPGPSWALVRRVGLDSIPKLRRAVLEVLVNVGRSTTTDIGEAVAHPTSSTKRALEDLACHGVLVREAGGPGRADKWDVSEETARNWLNVTSPVSSDGVQTPASSPSSPSMSDSDLYSPTPSDKTGEVGHAPWDVEL